ncbi:MAG: electron-transfer flavoprotein:ubiquinone oxidoreductase [Candidatus Hodgkinia cicadicola]
MYDIVIVGAGPAGLTAAIKLKLLERALKIGLFEKAASIGGHLISGTILQLSAYSKYAKQYNLKSSVPVSEERTLCLNNSGYIDVSWSMPTSISNKGNVLLSLNELCINMCEFAKQLGVSVHTSSGIDNLIVNNDTVIGISIANGAKVLAKHTVLAEGACGVVSSKLIKRYSLKLAEPQTYALGIREEWTPALHSEAGAVWHTIGWPSTKHVNLAGGFVYTYRDKVAIGYVTHLSYANGYVQPYCEFAKFKSHPLICQLLVNSKRTKYGAKLISTGGINAIPEVCYSGCTIIGCSAGLINMLKLKGVHNALLSGDDAAERVVSLLCKPSTNKSTSWIKKVMWNELDSVRNACKLLKRCGKVVTITEHLVSSVLGIKLRLAACVADSASTELCSDTKLLPKNWGINDTRCDALKLSKLSYDYNSSHLSINNDIMHTLYDLRLYDKLTTRLCPAGVYSWVKFDKHYEFKIQYDNCVQCRSCCVKPAIHTIDWALAKKGGGPNYN